MDAVKYLKDKARMIKAGGDVLCGISCNECPLYDENNGTKVNCEKLESLYPEKAVEIVENWSKEHPIETRQSEFLKLYPNALLEKGILAIRPCDLDSDIECPDRDERCYSCKKNYWLEEIGEEKE